VCILTTDMHKQIEVVTCMLNQNLALAFLAEKGRLYEVTSLFEVKILAVICHENTEGILGCTNVPIMQHGR
jgi:hypothetical protein